jgi:hypothetical protein
VSKFSSIPDFSDTNPESIAAALRAIKASVELLTGQRQGQALGVPAKFVQAAAPVAGRQTIIERGDLWINDQTDVMSYWTGSLWKPLA